MAKILCPNGQYTGISATVAFAAGIGETDNPHLIDWFKSNGYTVLDAESDLPDEGQALEDNKQDDKSKGKNNKTDKPN